MRSESSDHNPEKERLANLRPALEIRSKVLAAIRTFFLERDFIEVETPVRVATPALELYIDAEPSGDSYLRTSPELHMKRLMAAGFERIFQMGACFRQGERGDRHHPEYTMLEWYRSDADYLDILTDTKTLIVYVANEVLGTTDIRYQGVDISLSPLWEFITVSDAFMQFAGWDPLKEFDEKRFDLDLVDRVEPNLPQQCPVVFSDYPAEQAALSRKKAGNPSVAERWELYIAGVELANAYSELTDVEEQKARFEQWSAERRKNGRETYPLDQAFLSALESGLPECAGIALGVDRLVMLLADAADLDEVIAFREG